MKIEEIRGKTDSELGLRARLSSKKELFDLRFQSGHREPRPTRPASAQLRRVDRPHPHDPARAQGHGHPRTGAALAMSDAPSSAQGAPVRRSQRRTLTGHVTSDQDGQDHHRAASSASSSTPSTGSIVRRSKAYHAHDEAERGTRRATWSRSWGTRRSASSSAGAWCACSRPRPSAGPRSPRSTASRSRSRARARLKARAAEVTHDPDADHPGRRRQHRRQAASSASRCSAARTGATPASATSIVASVKKAMPGSEVKAGHDRQGRHRARQQEHPPRGRHPTCASTATRS